MQSIDIYGVSAVAVAVACWIIYFYWRHRQRNVKKEYTFINVDGRRLAVKAHDLDEAQDELLKVLEWEWKE